MKTLLLAGVMLAGFSVPFAANAGLLAQYSIDGGTTFNLVCSAASGGNCSPGAVVTSPNGLQFTIFGATSNSPGTAQDADLLQATVRMTNVTSTTASIILRVGDINFAAPTAPPNSGLSFINSLSGTVITGGAANLFASDACVQQSNAQNNCAGAILTPLINANITLPGAGSNSSTQGIASLVAPYSMTEFLNITLAPGATINFSASADVVPASEPASLALMGVGLVGLGWIVSRRRNVVSSLPA